MRLFHAARWSVALLPRLLYQSSVKPDSGRLGVAEALKENNGSSNTGK